MDDYADWTDRRAIDYARVVLAFVGFLLGLGGLLTSRPAPAVVGALLLVAAIFSFLTRNRAT